MHKSATSREQLRSLLRGGRTMNEVDRYAAQGVISWAARDRYHRLWAVSTATEHLYTRNWTLQRWTARREKVRRAITKALLASALQEA